MISSQQMVILSIFKQKITKWSLGNIMKCDKTQGNVLFAPFIEKFKIITFHIVYINY